MPPTTQKQIRAVALEKLERVHGELEDLIVSKTIKHDDREVLRYIHRRILEAIALLGVSNTEATNEIE